MVYFFCLRDCLSQAKLVSHAVSCFFRGPNSSDANPTARERSVPTDQSAKTFCGSLPIWSFHSSRLQQTVLIGVGQEGSCLHWVVLSGETRQYLDKLKPVGNLVRAWEKMGIATLNRTWDSQQGANTFQIVNFTDIRFIWIFLGFLPHLATEHKIARWCLCSWNSMRINQACSRTMERPETIWNR